MSPEFYYMTVTMNKVGQYRLGKRQIIYEIPNTVKYFRFRTLDISP